MKSVLVLSLIVFLNLVLLANSVLIPPNVDDSYLYGNELVKKPSEAGALQVIEYNGIKTLGDEEGNPIQLRGMSTHGLQWFPEILNENAFAALANDWEANVIRLAMYVGEDGYATDPDTIKERIIQGIELAKKYDMYVIVDWHVHAPGDPTDPIYEGAQEFFKEISELYPNDPHIVYELCNEPNGIPNDETGWQIVKNYAEPIIEMLRKNGNENIVIVGSPNWSQRPDLAADDPIDDKNTVYTLHFYAGTHEPSPDSYVMKNAIYALEHGAPIFVSEWGTSEATGDGGPYIEESDEWLKFLNANNVSWVNWSLTNKNEKSAAFTPYIYGESEATDLDPGPDQIWSPEELSVSGEYVRTRIKGIEYEPIDRSYYYTTLWDFDDGTTQGFVVNSDSPVTDVSLTNEENRLKISGLDASNDVSEDGFWNNLRISADNWGNAVDITEAEKIMIDVILKSPATVSIAAIPQGPGNDWWTNPARAVRLFPNDFVKQVDGTYKAVLTITAEDSPGLEIIGTSDTDNTIQNIVLFVGTEGADVIYLDNFKVSGKKIEIPIIHDPLGEAKLPSDFEDGTRQGWKWSSDSAVQTALTIEEANDSKALSWEVAYPEVKPSVTWASAPRLDFWMDGLKRRDKNFLFFDFYLAPDRASEGIIEINLAFQPPSAGYWAQATDTYQIDLSDLDSATVTNDGLYHYEVKIDLNSAPNIEDNTDLRNMLLIFVDVNSDFAGKMYIDNVNLIE